VEGHEALGYEIRCLLPRRVDGEIATRPFLSATRHVPVSIRSSVGPVAVRTPQLTDGQVFGLKLARSMAV